MKHTKLYPLFLLFSFVFILFACEDETTTLGSGIASGEVEISIDTFYFNLNSNPISLEDFDSKTGNLMLGSIFTKDYGKLQCSFVTRLMCATDLQVEDSLLYPERVDSCKLIMAADRNDIIGDSLAPQKLSVYMLDKQLPSNINNTFNPEGFYNPSSLMGSLSYTVSNVSSSDSMFYKGSYIELDIDLPVEFGKEIFEKYRNSPEIFQWPKTFREEFVPGLYLKPEFGNGCIANIEELLVAVYYHYKADVTTITDNDTIVQQQNKMKSVLAFTTSPEVLSSNIISYKPSEKIQSMNQDNGGDCVLTTPGGYVASFNFPIQTIIDRYKEKNMHLSTVNDLILYIPAEEIETNDGLPVVENILLVKSSEYEDFFNKNKIPDNVTAFTGVYDATRQRYQFASMRQYFLDLLDKEEITDEDVEFTLVPVEISTETNNSYYGTPTTYVTKCVPYIKKPTVTLLKTSEAMVTFSFSTQMID